MTRVLRNGETNCDEDVGVRETFCLDYPQNTVVYILKVQWLKVDLWHWVKTTRLVGIKGACEKVSLSLE